MAVGQKHWGAVMFVCCFQTPQQEGCRGWCGGTKNPTQKYKFLSFTGFMWVTQILVWNAEISPLIKIVSMKELAFRIPAYWLASLFVCLFLKCCRHSWHFCHLKVTAALPIFTWRHTHHWELFWEMATCPLIQKCDFWMECRQMISAEWVSSRGRLLHLIFFVW